MSSTRQCASMTPGCALRTIGYSSQSHMGFAAVARLLLWSPACRSRLPANTRLFTMIRPQTFQSLAGLTSSSRSECRDPCFWSCEGHLSCGSAALRSARPPFGGTQPEADGRHWRLFSRLPSLEIDPSLLLTMALTRHLKALPIAAFVVLCVASLTAEVMRVRTAASDIQSHQARWNCLALESGKVPRCVELAKRRPEDADYCEEAVSKCTALGTYKESADADQRHLMWDRLGAWLRVLLVPAALGVLAWALLVNRARRRLLQPTGR